jgi:RHS repeat-associated protein
MAADEQFRWDAASNPIQMEPQGSPPDSLGSVVPGNRLLIWQDARYAYDVHGNLSERLQGKRGSAGQIRTLFTWNAAHHLVRADVARGPDETASTQTFIYGYDALGRRIAKTDAFGITHFAWDGDRMALEQRGGHEIMHLYHPESFVPLAQVHNGALHHLHTDHLGTPLEASNNGGEKTWLVTYRTWGNVVAEDVAEIQQSLRFQGQYFDPETGLHYNRYRYYDPHSGRFVSQDPIGLYGGTNLQQYAPNPTQWIDPWGLARRKKSDPAPTIQHQPNCACKQGYAYRVLRDDEDPTQGLTPKNPEGNYTLEGFVLHGSKVSTQYIAASGTFDQAVSNSAKYGTGRERIARIDLSQLDDSVDVKSECAAIKGNTARNRAKASGEISIVGRVPPSAIKIVRP